MIVLIPSYKRTDLLKFVIQSVLKCEVSSIDERILILVVNNFFPNKQVVNDIVKDIKVCGGFQCQVVHREIQMTPIESWYSALFSNAKKNEVVCLLGDDDIIMPWGLENRYHQIIAENADMLLSDFHSKIVFFQGGTKYWISCETPNKPSVSASAVAWEGLPPLHPEPSFLSNHCYRNTEGLMRGFETAMHWCRRQNWVPLEIATGNFPFYMAYAIKESCGKIVSLNEKSVLRGSVSEEIRFQDYADGGNSAFYHLLICNTFSNETLHTRLDSYKEVRRLYKKGFISGMVSIIPNKKISWKMLVTTLKHTSFTFRDFLVIDLIGNLRCVILMVPKVRGYRTYKIGKSAKLKPISELGRNIRRAWDRG